jgi:ubiquinone/menaquinone biosynthesis C-methylase UbiE
MSEINNIEFHTPFTAKIFRVLTSGLREQNFLGLPLIPFFFKLVPGKYRRGLALRILGMSPHYFIYQWTTKYPSTMARKKILEAEHKRIMSSRKEICEQILQKYLNPQMTVLDFGCGPGYLAREVAKNSKKVLAVDVSSGVIACAKELNNSDNISYYPSDGKSLSILESSSIDLIYSFAVVQHLSEELFEETLREFFRVLKPQGKIVCHVVLGDKLHTELEYKKSSFISMYLREKFSLRMVHRSAEDVSQKIINTGFKDPSLIPVKQISDIEDTIADQHLFVFSRP